MMMITTIVRTSRHRLGRYVSASLTCPNTDNLVIGGCEVGDDGLKDPSDYSRGNKGERFQCGHSEAPEGHETCPIRAPARDDHAFKP